MPARGPVAVAGLTLAMRTHARPWASLASDCRHQTATVVLALSATFVGSATTLTETPSSYGFDANVPRTHAYGDQSPAALARAFGLI